MNWKIPKNTDKYYWTQHVVGKMHHYGLSEQKVLGVIRRPKRIETGIAPDTVAVMQVAGTIKKGVAPRKSAFANASARQLSPEGESWNQEIWVMYQLKTDNRQQTTDNKKLTAQINKIQNPKLQKLQEAINSPKKLTIISAWRYPGVSPQKDPIPAEIWREIEELYANNHELKNE